MLDRTKKAEFIREGLARYPDARETVDYFQSSVMEAIFTAFETKMNWKTFQPRRLGGSLESGRGIGDRFIQGWIEGTLQNLYAAGEKMWLTLGLYWRPPRRPSAPVVAACHASREKGALVPLVDVPGRNQRINIGPLYKPGESRLLLEPGQDFDLSETFSLLLDTADEALVTVSADVATGGSV